MTGYEPIFEAGHVLGERRGRRSRLELLPLPDCGAGCPVDHVRKGWIEVSGSGGRDGDELAVKIRLRGALRGGQKVDLQDQHAGFLFHPSNILDFCPLASVPDVAVRNGRSERNASGLDVATDWPLGPGTVFSFCSGAWIRSDASPLGYVLQGGIVVGADPAAREASSRDE